MNSNGIYSQTEFDPTELQKFYEEFIVDEKPLISKEDQSIYSLVIGQYLGCDHEELELEDEASQETSKKVVYLKSQVILKETNPENAKDLMNEPIVDEGFKLGIVTGLVIGVISLASREVTKHFN